MFAFDDPNWQMTVLFLFALALMTFAMKLAAHFRPTTVSTKHANVFWILFSPTSLRRLRPADNAAGLFLRTVYCFGLLFLSYWIYWQLVNATGMRGFFLGYCAAPILLLMMMSLSALMTLILLPSGLMLPSLHHRPWRMRSVADFWGRRWNLWFSEWMRFTVFQPLRRRPALALTLGFALSGLIHEAVINVPLYIVTGRMLFGAMTFYFLMQAAGVLIERRFKNHPRLQVLFAWLVVFEPAPLVINEGMLRVLHLWPE